MQPLMIYSGEMRMTQWINNQGGLKEGWLLRLEKQTVSASHSSHSGKAGPLVVHIYVYFGPSYCIFTHCFILPSDQCMRQVEKLPQCFSRYSN